MIMIGNLEIFTLIARKVQLQFADMLQLFPKALHLPSWLASFVTFFTCIWTKQFLQLPRCSLKIAGYIQVFKIIESLENSDLVGNFTY